MTHKPTLPDVGLVTAAGWRPWLRLGVRALRTQAVGLMRPPVRPNLCPLLSSPGSPSCLSLPHFFLNLRPLVIKLVIAIF